MPRVFISYSHDSEPHKERVQKLAMRLRGDGVEVVIDQDKMPGGPDEGWQLWSEMQVRVAERVLIACTANYCARYENTAPPGVGLGVACEAGIIRQEIYESKGVVAKYRPIAFDGCLEEHVPVALRRYHRFAVQQESGYQELLGWLRGTTTVAVSSPPLARPAWPDPLGRRPVLADRKEEFEIFERMITGRSRERILLLGGKSGSGKTTLATELCKYARELSVLCASADLKGCPTQLATLSVLKMRFGTGPFATAPSLDDLLHELRRAERPVLLALDTFESASDEMEQWTDRCLQMVEDLPYVVAMVSGQRVPDASKSAWRLLALPRQLEPINDVSDWVDYAREAYPGVVFDVKHIESLVLGTGGNPALLGTLLPNMMNRLPRVAAGGAP